MSNVSQLPFFSNTIEPVLKSNIQIQYLTGRTRVLPTPTGIQIHYSVEESNVQLSLNHPNSKPSEKPPDNPLRYYVIRYPK